jgi:inner membrane protein
MPTILSHPVVPLALGLGLGSRVIPPRLLAAGVLASILPDLDVIGFNFGVEYGSPFGHRGFSHSLSMALAVGLLAACFHKTLRAGFALSFAFVALSMASHGVLDAFTNGGSGVAFLWPFSDERFFAPFRVIEVSPIGVSRLFSERFLRVLESELLWLWLPGVVFACSLHLALRAADARRAGT